MRHLDALLAASRVAHEAIFSLHSEALADGLADERIRPLLAESVQLVLQELPGLTATARGLEAAWVNQAVRDPAQATRTENELATEVARLDPVVRRILARQREIAQTLRSMLDADR